MQFWKEHTALRVVLMLLSCHDIALLHLVRVGLGPGVVLARGVVGGVDLGVHAFDIKRWWEVMDRTAGTPLSPEEWSYDGETGGVVIQVLLIHRCFPFSAFSVLQRACCTEPG